MSLEHTWSAVLRPDRADRYFSAHGETLFNPAICSYDDLTAWWMAEFCRLIYRRGRGEPADYSPPSRQTILAQVGLIERLFVSNGGAECSIVAPRAGSVLDFQVVVFRGANTVRDWLDFVLHVGPSGWPTGGLVHKGFRDAFDLVWPTVESELRPGVPTVYTGHSMGGALTALAAASRRPTAAYSFGAPVVGDRAFARTLDGLPLYRIVNVGDLATRVGPTVLGHAGQFRYIAENGSMLVDPMPNDVSADRRHRPLVVPGRPIGTYLIGPPRMCADHAPINYVVRLERLVQSTPSTAASMLPLSPLSAFPSLHQEE